VKRPRDNIDAQNDDEENPVRYSCPAWVDMLNVVPSTNWVKGSIDLTTKREATLSPRDEVDDDTSLDFLHLVSSIFGIFGNAKANDVRPNKSVKCTKDNICKCDYG
jgi:hypothetical protein